MSISPMLLGIRNTAITTQHKSLGQEKGVKKCINQEKNPNNPSLNTQSCNRRPLCSTFTFENVRSPKKTVLFQNNSEQI